MPGLSHHATILPVSQMERSLGYYVQQLGFECTFQWEEPPTYAVLKQDGVSIHLALSDDPIPLNSHARIYIFCSDVDKLYQLLQKRSIEFIQELNTADYHMKEFQVIDPDGHILVFGMGQNRDS